jgi:hypothetical protein
VCLRWTYGESFHFPNEVAGENRKLKKWLTPTILFIALVLAGCQHDPHAHLYTTTEPKNEDVVGVYVLDQFHLSLEAGTAHPDVKVELRADGTFTATNVPPSKIETIDKTFFHSLQSGSGKWEKAQTGMLDSKTIWGVNLNTPDNRFYPASFTGDKPPYGMIFTLGDPDSGDAIILKRKPE